MRAALLIIDMQNDFVLPGAPLCVRGAAPSVPVIRRLLLQARAQGLPVIHIIRQHNRDGSDVEKSRQELFQEGPGVCVPGTEGAQIVPALAPEEGEYIVHKRRFSAFFQTELDMLLRRLGVDTLLVTGTQYPNCVRGTAVDGMSLDYDVIVVTDACSAQSPDVEQANIRDMRNMGIRCLALNDLPPLTELPRFGGI
ncbi:isochorismatase family cysteine hydrolase [uncultured Desulfovibrio sp.]|uniref:cysteine hydrolase family protein n=1 Tax=uncultured Desulfovibrio sp. TaxID=167968 RepID=UPI0026055E59|nr:isochorismatase family cysteine hydrolase [uncultured Desulfovibrio sp.]